jgi:hypothetical protein
MSLRLISLMKTLVMRSRRVRPLLEAPVADRRNWTLARRIVEIEAREGVIISKSRLSKVLREKIRWRRRRHSLKGRQDADAVDRVGLRIALRKAQAEVGDMALLFAGESEALTHPYVARAGPSAAPICACRRRAKPRRSR